MKKSGIAFICLFLSICLNLKAQQYLTSKDSDKEALAYLQKAGTPFVNGNAVVNFTNTLTFPGEKPITTSGILEQSGNSFNLNIPDYQIISDGTTRWVYMKKANEVNIYSNQESNDWLNPQDFLTLHKATDLVFIVSNKKDDGTIIIEAKPLKGRFEDFSKITLHLKNNKLIYLLALAKDSSRQEISISSTTFPDTIDKSKFTFDASKYPGVHIEDLRTN